MDLIEGPTASCHGRLVEVVKRIILLNKGCTDDCKKKINLIPVVNQQATYIMRHLSLESLAAFQEIDVYFDNFIGNRKTLKKK